MGVKDLWSVLTPYAERKPFSELRGKKVAIDLAGWVCESLNVVDYFVHPRHHLKNLFFRTCYLIWEEVTPVFVLEGVAPKLKSQVIAKRNELQFRGVKPKDKSSPPTQCENVASKHSQKDKGRTRFNHVLKQCENLLQAMGIQCVQGPGEAEAYCSFLNKHGLVDGVISQDSDCFAYGAYRVYRNFSVSTQGAQAASGGAVDIYDMREICARMDFGQNKVIVMALFCGCDYCPEGIGGIGKDSVLKLFNKYKDSEILERLRNWRLDSDKYNALEMRVDDKTICSNCGHIGRTQSHTKSGCGVCRTNRGCDESRWKEQRLSLKAELMLRKKALSDPLFPSEDIIAEFLSGPTTVPDLNLSWRQPNIVKFIKQIGHLLQWPEIYCFEKFFPILTRWQVQNAARLRQIDNAVALVEPKEIVKKRTVKGIPSLEIIWHDKRNCFKGLIPDEQIREYEQEHPRGIEELYSTIEPQCLLEVAYADMVATFLKSKEKPKKVPKAKKTKITAPLKPLDNLKDLMDATDEIVKNIKPAKRTKKVTASTKKGLQLIEKFFKEKENTPVKLQRVQQQCSTPINKCLPSDLESDCDADEFDMSDIINGIITNPKAAPAITKHAGHLLHYESLTHDISREKNRNMLDEILADTDLSNQSKLQQKSNQYSLENSYEQLDVGKTVDSLVPQNQLDDADLLTQKRNLSICNEVQQTAKRYSLDDSFDLLVKGAKTGVRNYQQLMKKSICMRDTSSPIETPVERFKRAQRLSVSQLATTPEQKVVDKEVSYFFNHNANDGAEDVFERLMDMSIGRQSRDLVIISDSE